MRKKRREKKRTGYTQAHVFALCVGHDFFSDSFGRDEGAVERMREAWPVLREQAFALQQQRGGPDSLPWCYWQFEAPEPYRGGRPRNEAAVVQELRQAGVLPDIVCDTDRNSGIAQSALATLEEKDIEVDDVGPAESDTAVTAPPAELPAEQDTEGDIDNSPRPNGI
jgi:hypothetical protein